MKNIIIDLKNATISDEYHERVLLKNVNISFEEGQNVCIFSSSDNEFETCQRFVSVLSGNAKIDSGDISYAKFDDQSRKYIFGYNNFANIITKKVKPIEIIEALFAKEKIIDSNQNEIVEIIRFLNLDIYMNDLICDLTQNQKNQFNIIFLLIIKPRVLFVEDLPLYGPTNSQIAILKFIKEYLKKHNITLILSSNDALIRKELCQRYVEINNTKIISDRVSIIQESTNENQIDNKTKAFDLETELDFSLNSSSKWKSPSNAGFINGSNSHANANNLNPTSKPKIAYDTDSLYRDFDKALNASPQQIYNEKLNQKFSQKLDIIRSKTRELKFESEDLIEEIKLKNPTRQFNQQKIVSPARYNHQNSVDDDIIQDIIDTYIIKKQLEQQIKSPDFIKLSVDLQHKVFDNYERADRLIRENDPTGKYDPNRISNLNVSTTNNYRGQNNGFTRMILSEELGIGVEKNYNDEHIKNIYKSKTSEFEIDGGSIGRFPSNELIDDYKSQDRRERDNFETKSSKFKNFFKNNTKPSKYYQQDKYYDDYDDHRHQSRGSKKQDSYEPTRNVTERLTKEINSRHNYTAKYSNDNFEPSYSKPKPNKPIKTKAIKTRVKKNKIEQLYEEALADQELANDLKEK